MCDPLMQKIFVPVVPKVPIVPIVQACAGSRVQEFKCSRLETDAVQDVKGEEGWRTLSPGAINAETAES
jgi:hypothetical protein